MQRAALIILPLLSLLLIGGAYGEATNKKERNLTRRGYRVVKKTSMKAPVIGSSEDSSKRYTRRRPKKKVYKALSQELAKDLAMANMLAPKTYKKMGSKLKVIQNVCSSYNKKLLSLSQSKGLMTNTSIARQKMQSKKAKSDLLRGLSLVEKQVIGAIDFSQEKSGFCKKAFSGILGYAMFKSKSSKALAKKYFSGIREAIEKDDFDSCALMIEEALNV